LWSIVLALVLGIIVGWINILPKFIVNHTNEMTMIGLVVLLFTMGLSIGSNAEILNNLNTLGIKAFLLAFGSIVGSVILAWSLEKRFFKR
jgi:uncharacterized membrane protein YbjE (DUF340 family)